MNDELEKALENLARNGDLYSFGQLITSLNIHAFILKRPINGHAESVLPAKAQVCLNDHNLPVVFAFGSKGEAEYFLKVAGTKLFGTLACETKEYNGQKLLLSVAAMGLSLWVNPKQTKNETHGGRLFSPSETVALIGLVSPDNTTVTQITLSQTVPDIQELDLSKSKTLVELCDIFYDEDPSEIAIRLSRLVEKGIVNFVSSPFDKEIKLYEPLASFYLGFGSYSPRGREFRDWFKRLITICYIERGDATNGIHSLLAENSKLKKELDFSESFKQKVKREYQKLKSKLEQEKIVHSEAMDSVLLTLEAERNQRAKDGFIIENLYKKVARLENDIRASEEWPYPTGLDEVLTAVEKLYSSKLVIAPGKHRVEVTDPTMEKHQGLVTQAVTMFKALALSLYPMKFNFGGLNLNRFKEDTGLELYIATGKDNPSSTICTRRVAWQGQHYVCNNYIQAAKDNCRLLIHFKFLDDERKILISHLTAFAISGLFKLAT
ncbi:MAG: PspA/IM30 family protein [Deltaproteobacteria bacterium]|nr:PspA/IM30 family protein [Deltaproteobacteria bacterium]